MASCCPEHSYVCLQHHEHLGTDIVDSVHYLWRGVDICHNILPHFNLLGAPSFCDDAGDIFVLVCVRSSMQGVVVWKEADTIANVSSTKSISCGAAAGAAAGAATHTVHCACCRCHSLKNLSNTFYSRWMDRYQRFARVHYQPVHRKVVLPNAAVGRSVRNQVLGFG